jgi:hypothetical protein
MLEAGWLFDISILNTKWLSVVPDIQAECLTGRVHPRGCTNSLEKGLLGTRETLEDKGDKGDS